MSSFPMKLSFNLSSEQGLICSGTKLSQWWIPSDMYTLKYKANDIANIPATLENIRLAIKDGTFDEITIACKTIQKVHM